MQGIVQTAALLLFKTKNTKKIPVVSGSNTADSLFNDIRKTITNQFSLHQAERSEIKECLTSLLMT